MQARSCTATPPVQSACRKGKATTSLRPEPEIRREPRIAGSNDLLDDCDKRKSARVCDYTLKGARVEPRGGTTPVSVPSLRGQTRQRAAPHL